MRVVIKYYLFPMISILISFFAYPYNKVEEENADLVIGLFKIKRIENAYILDLYVKTIIGIRLYQ